MKYEAHGYNDPAQGYDGSKPDPVGTVYASRNEVRRGGVISGTKRIHWTPGQSVLPPLWVQILVCIIALVIVAVVSGSVFASLSFFVGMSVSVSLADDELGLQLGDKYTVIAVDQMPTHKIVKVSGREEWFDAVYFAKD